MTEHEAMQSSSHTIASSLHYQPEVYAARFGEYSNLDTADVSNLTAIGLPQQSNVPIIGEEQQNSNLSFTRLLAHSSAPSVSDYTCRKEAAAEFVEPKQLSGADNVFSYSCEQCSFVTKCKSSLKRHAKVHDNPQPTVPDDTRPFECDRCGKRYKKKYSLKEHENTHLQDHEKPFVCNQCSRRFATSGVLGRHMRYRHSSTADADKLYRCDQCSYSSVEKSKLRRHVRTHTLERPFRCEYCLYAARDEFKLKRHIRTHTLEKPYECTVCHVRFAQLDTLKRHGQLHRDNRDATRLKCDICSTTFYRAHDLDKHRQVQHSAVEPPLACSNCSAHFTDRHSLKLHVRDHHVAKQTNRSKRTDRKAQLDCPTTSSDTKSSAVADAYEQLVGTDAQPASAAAASSSMHDDSHEERDSTTASELLALRSEARHSRTFRSEDESAEMFEAASAMLSMAKESNQLNETDSETRSQSPSTVCTLR